MIWIVSSILFIFTLLGVVIGASTLNDYRTVQGRHLGLILFSSSLASFAYGMEILSPELHEKFIWVVVHQVCPDFKKSADQSTQKCGLLRFDLGYT